SKRDWSSDVCSSDLLESFIDSIGSLGDLGLDGLIDLVGVFLQELAGLVSSVFRIVAGLLLFTTLLIFFSVCFRVLDHAVDLFLSQAGTILDQIGRAHVCTPVTFR